MNQSEESFASLLLTFSSCRFVPDFSLISSRSTKAQKLSFISFGEVFDSERISGTFSLLIPFHVSHLIQGHAQDCEEDPGQGQGRQGQDSEEGPEGLDGEEEIRGDQGQVCCSQGQSVQDRRNDPEGCGKDGTQTGGTFLESLVHSLFLTSLSPISSLASLFLPSAVELPLSTIWTRTRCPVCPLTSRRPSRH